MGVISLTHPELSTSSQQERQEQILSIVIDQLRELIGGGVYIDDIKGEGKLNQLFNAQEFIHLLASWIDEIHSQLIKTMSFVENEIRKPFRYNKAERKHLLRLSKNAFDAFLDAKQLVDTNIEQRGIFDENTLTDIFIKYREAYIQGEQIKTDPLPKQRQTLSIDQQAVVYAPFWVPIILPLFRKIEK